MQLNVIGSAVYILILEGVVVYVGESISAYSRIGSHVKDTKKRFDTIRILPCLEHRRKYWEAVLIDRYQPIFNTRGKDKKTAKRHTHALSLIRKGQKKRMQTCLNCKRNQQFSIYGQGVMQYTSITTANLGAITTAVTSAGQVTMETVPASDDLFVNLAHEEERHKKKVAWDDSVGYVEKLNNSLDASFKLSNPYSNRF